MTKKVTRWLAALLPATAAAGLLLSGTAAASTQNSVRFGYCQALGNYATCTASGNVNRPLTITVSVYTLPEDLSVTVYWNVICSQGSGAGSSSGQFTRDTPKVWILQHPYSRPDSCTVAASAGVNGNSARIRVYLDASQW